MTSEDERRTPAAAGSTERPGATRSAAGTDTIRPEFEGSALGGSSGTGDYGPGRGSGGSDFAGADRGGGSTAAPELPSQADDGRHPSSGRGATTGDADGGVDGGPGGRTAGSSDRGGGTER